MEFFDWANFVSVFFGQTILVKELYIIFAVAAGIYLVCLVFGGIGMHVMAQKAGVKHSWLAFIPFANTFYAGKLAGECNLFGQRLKRGGLYAALAEFVCFALNVFYYVIIILLVPYYVEYPAGDVQTSGYQGVPDSLMWLVNGKWVVNMLSSIAMIVQLFLLCLVFFALYRKYYARSPFVMTLASVILPFRGFILFAVRNNVPVDYNEYVRRRAEAYRTQQGMPPYNNAPNQTPPQSGNGAGSAGDPFSEFGGSSPSGGADDPFPNFRAARTPTRQTRKSSGKGASFGQIRHVA